MNEKIYHDVLLEHFKYPQNKKTIATPSFDAGDHNPSCGDSISMQGVVDHNKITDLGFGGKGCVISQATASMLTEACIGKTIEEIMKLDANFIKNLVGINLGPTRLKCALLSLQVLHQGLASLHNK